MMEIKNYRNTILALTAAGLGAFAFAQDATKTAPVKKRSHGAHVHGVVHFNIALENEKSGTIEVISPGESIIGFEHAASTAKDKATQKSALDDFAKLSNYVAFDPKASCTLNKTKLDIVPEKHHDDDDDDHDGHEHHGQHTEVHAEFALSCQNSVSGSEVKIDLGKRFSRIHQLDVQVVGESKQSDFDLKDGKGTVKL